MPSPPLVSAIIPTYNRARELLRAIQSVRAQTYSTIELLVIDDGSTDDTELMVRSLGDERIRYFRHPDRRNAAAARNTGLAAAEGKYVAFLDSDDQWMPDHLARKVAHLEGTEDKGVFSSYYLAWRTGMVEFRCTPPPYGMSIAEYIFSGLGNTHTSTLVLQRAAMLEVKFDDTLEKHQDWDVAIRFAQKFPIHCDQQSTVIVHPEGDQRMSYTMIHTATRRFLTRHANSLRPATRAQLYATFAKRTLQAEGRNSHFSEYLGQAWRLWGAADFRAKVMIAGLSIPVMDRALLKAGHWYQLFRRSRTRTTPSLVQNTTGVV